MKNKGQENEKGGEQIFGDWIQNQIVSNIFGVVHFKGKLRKSLFYEFGSCIEIGNAVWVEKIVSIDDYLSIREQVIFNDVEEE